MKSQISCRSTVSTASARKPWLTVYRAHAGFDTSARGIIHNTQVVPLHARVPDLEPNRGQISRHFWSAWWSSFWSIFGFSDFPGLGIYFARRVGASSTHPGDVLNVWLKFWVLFVATFSTFLVRMVAGFGPTSRVNRIYSPRAETMVGGLPRAFRSFGKRLNDAKVGHHDPKFRIFAGFHVISGLTPATGLSLPGIIIRAQVMFLNARVTSLTINF